MIKPDSYCVRSMRRLPKQLEWRLPRLLDGVAHEGVAHGELHGAHEALGRGDEVLRGLDGAAELAVGVAHGHVDLRARTRTGAARAGCT